MIADVSCVVCLEYYIVRQLFLCVTELGHLTELGHHAVFANICVLDQNQKMTLWGKTPTTARGKTPMRVGVLPRGFAGRHFAPNALLLWP